MRSKSVECVVRDAGRQKEVIATVNFLYDIQSVHGRVSARLAQNGRWCLGIEAYFAIKPRTCG